MLDIKEVKETTSTNVDIKEVDTDTTDIRELNEELNKIEFKITRYGIIILTIVYISVCIYGVFIRS